MADRTFTDANGERWRFDPAWKVCHGEGRFVAGHSGREDDGDAPIWEDCDCFLPVDPADAAITEHDRLRAAGFDLADDLDRPDESCDCPKCARFYAAITEGKPDA